MLALSHPRRHHFPEMACASPVATEVNHPLENEDDKKFPLSDTALVAFLKSASDASMIGITILNVYSASIAFGWAKISLNVVSKSLLIGLPFSVLPILFMISNIVKVAENGGCSLSIAASLVLSEFIYMFVLGGVMTVLLTEASKIAVASVTAILIRIIIKLWGRVSNHPKCLSVLNSDHLDIENCLSVGSKPKLETPDLIQKDAMQADLIKKSLNICFVVYTIFYIEFMLLLAIVAERWWHALLAIVIMSPIHISGLYLTTYLRDGLIRACGMGPPDVDTDLGCKLVASGKL